MGTEVRLRARKALIFPALTLSGVGFGFLPLVLLTLVAVFFRLSNTFLFCSVFWFVGCILGYFNRRRGTPLD